MKIIGILGPAGSGKTLTSNYMVQKYGAKKYSFAYPLKEVVRQAFDLTDMQVYGSQADKEAVDPRYNVSPRWLLQRLGTEGIRDVLGKDFWWQSCLERILAEQPELVVIDDFRFTNEVDGFLKLNEGVNPKYPIVHIWRLEPAHQRQTLADQSHQSEAEWSRCTFTNVVRPADFLPKNVDFNKIPQDTLDDMTLQAAYEAIDATADECKLTPTVAVLK